MEPTQTKFRVDYGRNCLSAAFSSSLHAFFYKKISYSPSTRDFLELTADFLKFVLKILIFYYKKSTPVL